MPGRGRQDRFGRRSEVLKRHAPGRVHDSNSRAGGARLGCARRSCPALLYLQYVTNRLPPTVAAGRRACAAAPAGSNVCGNSTAPAYPPTWNFAGKYLVDQCGRLRHAVGNSASYPCAARPYWVSTRILG